ncbi:MAG: DUF4136 domain-containing protein [Hymenobacteraceae bacterium]|nr:DUF4136 domain-containing protein [Hymenobacteraceae bacterium]MDX5394770.1 DUF4136 domain-containing protein [Hymenobacteraceae bacterium]MDX5442632.1 DUF4136 domain-containing protein [Hymenobacteraceae bacterium]MDX5510801.1 DUF4136 domain-containing protein [Hymenobacteraceae bacterium]
MKKPHRRLSEIWHWPVLTVLFLMLLQSCNVSSLLVKVNTAYDQNARFETYKTYNWYQPNPAAAAQSIQPYTDNLHNHIRKAIEQELNKKGLQKTSANPDLLVAYDVSIPHQARRPVSQPLPADFGYSYAWLMGYRYDYSHTAIPNYQPVSTYKPNTIIVDLIDANTRELVWRGWVEEVVEDYNATYKTVENYVDDIIDTYPPR